MLKTTLNSIEKLDVCESVAPNCDLCLYEWIIVSKPT